MCILRRPISETYSRCTSLYCSSSSWAIRCTPKLLNSVTVSPWWRSVTIMCTARARTGKKLSLADMEASYKRNRSTSSNVRTPPLARMAVHTLRKTLTADSSSLSNGRIDKWITICSAVVAHGRRCATRVMELFWYAVTSSPTMSIKPAIPESRPASYAIVKRANGKTVNTHNPCSEAVRSYQRFCTK